MWWLISEPSQTCQLSLIQSETQAIAPSNFRLQSEKIAPMANSFMYIIIDWIQFWKNVPIIFKSHSIDPSWPHQRLAGLAESMVNFGQAPPSPGQDWQSGQLRNSYDDKDETCSSLVTSKQSNNHHNFIATQVIAGLVECAIHTYNYNRPTLAMVSCAGHGLLGTTHTCVCKRVVLPCP